MDKFHFPPELTDTTRFRGMSHWFSPRVLVKILRNVVVSTIFGRYADRRLLHASLDPIEATEIDERCGVPLGICEQKDGAVWLDYVADLGDGFNSTYAIASLLGRNSIQVDGVNLPRAGCLVMGGDQVYPDASREDYKWRMQMPYEAAFPRTDAQGSDHPRLFMIPGNHDWYDGLTLFLAKFCRGRDTHVGSWRINQHRSYFAFNLTKDWWVLGFDSQLGEDIDQPQANYFVNIVRKMPKGSKVILCASAPTWLHCDKDNNTKEEQEPFRKGLDYISNILLNEGREIRVPLIISGDLHHYSRFEADTGSMFVGAGGGGAFLHPTHGLPTNITLNWAKKTTKLKITSSLDSQGKEKESVYPDRKISRNLALGNFGFIFKNPDFAITLGGIYAFVAMLLLAFRGYGQDAVGATLSLKFCDRLASILPTPTFVLFSMAIFYILFNYADLKSKAARVILTACHSVMHIGIVGIATTFVSVLAYPLKNYVMGDILYFLAIVSGMILAGALGGIVWGIYLFVSSFFFKGHPNDAFSAMRLDSFRHFLRMKIEGETLTLYPIGIDNSPRSDDWQLNPSFKEWQQDQPYIVSKKPLGEHLVEKPVVIDAALLPAVGLPK